MLSRTSRDARKRDAALIRDPYSAAVVIGTNANDQPASNSSLGVWVPAFAGTTPLIGSAARLSST
ncbi:protein of unknown function [Bradyrhizobium sp. ORS 285]|nr:hypothetical protein BRAO285_1580032 [Bradyrhizobium sp. ORS 285]SMX59164.1 protein of unknown function [Bradyrhizobium sp. ORS 285]